MSTSSYFAADYASARAKFRAAASGAGARLEAFAHPALKGPTDEPLSIDVGFFGSETARGGLLLLSGTHGVEGFAGSGCQVGFCEDRLFEAFGGDACVILVHAVNPYGFAWLQRVNEDNVDLNRNFQDFDQPLPANPGYAALHDLLLPADWDGAARAQADAALMAMMGAPGGTTRLQAAVQGGQYSHPTGMFYGGNAETWSASTFKHILRAVVPASVTRLIALDLHTGLGPTGYGQPIVAGGDDQDRARAAQFFGPEVVGMTDAASVTAAVTGSIADAVARWPGGEATYLALEFGTRPLLEVLTALRGSHWLIAHPGEAPHLEAALRRAARDAFFLEAPYWQAAVYGRTADFVVRAARALAR